MKEKFVQIRDGRGRCDGFATPLQTSPIPDLHERPKEQDPILQVHFASVSSSMDGCVNSGPLVVAFPALTNRRLHEQGVPDVLRRSAKCEDGYAHIVDDSSRRAESPCLIACLPQAGNRPACAAIARWATAYADPHAVAVWEP